MEGIAGNTQGVDVASPLRTFHIVADLQWLWDSFQSGARLLSGQWDFRHDLGLWPIPHLGIDEPLWIDPAALVANNAWRQQRGLDPIAMLTPPDQWLGGLSPDLLGRSVRYLSVAEILAMDDFDERLGERPWSQPVEGRISGFRAARRTLAQLKHDLRGESSDRTSFAEAHMGSKGMSSQSMVSQRATSPAPPDAMLMVQSHLPSITEEWMVAIAGGKAFAASPYCIHSESSGTRVEGSDTGFGNKDSGFGNKSAAASKPESIVTIADMATGLVPPAIRFDKRHREAALDMATRALQETHASTNFAGMLNIAFREASSPAILELTPLWCSGPYGFSPGELATMLRAVASSRTSPRAISGLNLRPLVPGSQDQQQGQQQTPALNDMTVFTAGPWMVQHYAQRYIR
ncbi:hypothetical protein [Bifidobacterium aquikefiricola]|uniref:Uncharacterized protein n=1 Tax=Bifidobacterium aquikefiricola TaxID=3059038 RepID=A0AB39U5Y8_9BIFI